MHIITGQLRKATYIKAGVGKDGQSTMYGLELSEMIKDYKTGEKSYTNYKALLFAASPAHIEYYNKTLVEGNWVSLTCEKLKIEVSECGQYIKLFMENARIDAAGYIESAPQQQQGSYQQQAPQNQQQQQQQPQQQYKQQQQPQQQYKQQGKPQQQYKQQGKPQQQQHQQSQPQQQGGQQQQAKAPDLDDGWDDDIPF